MMSKGSSMTDFSVTHSLSRSPEFRGFRGTPVTSLEKRFAEWMKAKLENCNIESPLLGFAGDGLDSWRDKFTAFIEDNERDIESNLLSMHTPPANYSKISTTNALPEILQKIPKPSAFKELSTNHPTRILCRSASISDDESWQDELVKSTSKLSIHVETDQVHSGSCDENDSYSIETNSQLASESNDSFSSSSNSQSSFNTAFVENLESDSENSEINPPWRHRKGTMTSDGDDDEQNYDSSNFESIEEEEIQTTFHMTNSDLQCTSELDEVEEVVRQTPDDNEQSREQAYEEDFYQGDGYRKRKRKADPKNWAQNKRRRLLNSGFSYKTYEGITKSPRKMGPPCSCKQNCLSKVSHECRKQQFHHFYDLADWEKQNDFIGKMVSQKPKGRTRTNEEESRRRFSRVYTMKVEDSIYPVSKTFFLNTYAISDTRVRSILSKVQRSVIGATSPDRRGRHPPSIKFSGEVHQSVVDHIKSLPKEPAHLVRKDTTKIYLINGLNFTKAYELYIAYAEENNLQKVCRTVYNEHLQEMNIVVAQPLKDRCWCAEFHNLPEEARLRQQAEYDEHIKSKNLAREEKANDIRWASVDEEVMTASFDLQAILYSPLLNYKQIFYKRKFQTFNLTVYVNKTREGHCYMWDETEGEKGATEIASCLAEFIQHEVPSNVKFLNLYCDNCPGQNKNSVVMAMMAHACIKHPSLVQINLKFLEAGHTFMECDSVHSTIKKASISSNVYTPKHWRSVVKTARKKGESYIVHEMKRKKFMNYKNLRNEWKLEKLIFEDGSTMKWKDIKWIKISKRKPKTIKMKHDFSEDFKKMIVEEKFSDVSLERAYAQRFPISQKKYEDILSMCFHRQNIIPAEYHQFWVSLPHDTKVTDKAAGVGVMPGMSG